MRAARQVSPNQFNFAGARQSRGAPERAGATIWRGDRERHERLEPQERPERLVSIGGATRVPTAPTPDSREPAPNRTKTLISPSPALPNRQSSSSGAALIAPLRALGVSIGQSASARMNVLYADGGGEERRRTGGGSSSGSLERDGRAASTIHPTTTTTTRRALEQEVAGVRIAHCSWCLAECAHAQVSEGFLLFRAAYRCGACARRTLPCRAPGCDSHARGAGSTAPRDDDLCLVHRAIIPAWPCGVDAGYDAWTRDRLAPKARCSWCLDVRRHALEHVDSFAPAATAVSATAVSPAASSSSRTGRSSRWSSESFSCGGCARRTVRCETCERSLAEGAAGARENYAFAKAGDDRCARCLGVVYDWNAPADVNAQLTKTEPAWCGWCGERCAHLVRDKARAKCQCLVCGGGTAPCERCPGSMRTRERPVVVSSVASSVTRRGSLTRSTSVGTCLRCEVIRATPSDEEASAVWETVRTRRAAADAAAVRVRDVLARKTRWSKAAHDAGAWRPFALLATLPPRERVRIASRLGIRLCRERGYLDPHAEAWRVLATPGKGILARADAAGGGGGGGGGGGALGGLGRRVSASRGAEDDDDASAERTIGSVLRRVGRDISRAAGVSAGVPGRRRANWLEALASVLVAGAETGRCPALDPREAASLPVVASGRKGAARILRTPRALVVARYEECVLGMVAGAQRARLSPVQRLAIDSLKSHPMRVVLETRLKRSGADYRRMADAAVLAAFAASPWASVTEGNGVDGGMGDETNEPRWSLSDCAESIAADVYGCLLDGRAPTGPAGTSRSAGGGSGRLRTTPDGSGRLRTHDPDGDLGDEIWSGVAPSLLASLACQTVAVTAGPTGAALGAAAALGVTGAKLPGASFEDVTDFFAGVRAPSRVPDGAAGLFEPCAVVLVHGALLASRGVHVDDYHPGREERARDGRWGGVDPSSERRGRRGERLRGRAPSSGDEPRRYAESDSFSDSPVGVIGGLGGSSRVSDGGSDRGRVGAWADEQARAPPGPRSALSGSEMTVEEEEEEEEERVAEEEEREEPVEPPSPVPRHFSRVGPFARVFGEEREEAEEEAAAAEAEEAEAEAAEALPTSTRPGEEKGAGAGARSRTTQPATSTAFPEPPRATLTGNASRFESARANAEIDDWLEDEI